MAADEAGPAPLEGAGGGRALSPSLDSSTPSNIAAGNTVFSPLKREPTPSRPAAAAPCPRAGVCLRPVAPDDPRAGLRASPSAVAVAATRAWAAREVVGPYAAWVAAPPEFDTGVALAERRCFEAFAVTAAGAVPAPRARAAAAAMAAAAAAGRGRGGGGGEPAEGAAAPAEGGEEQREPLVFCAYPPGCAGPLGQLNDWRRDPEAEAGASGPGGAASEEAGGLREAADGGDGHKRRKRAGGAAARGGGEDDRGGGGAATTSGGGPNCVLARTALLLQQGNKSLCCVSPEAVKEGIACH